MTRGKRKRPGKDEPPQIVTTARLVLDVDVRVWWRWERNRSGAQEKMRVLLTGKVGGGGATGALQHARDSVPH